MSSARFAFVLAILAALLVLAGGRPAYAGPKALKCAFAKQAAAIQEADALLGCQRKAERQNTTVDPACTAAAIAALDAAFQQAEANGGCKPTDDADRVKASVDSFTTDIGQQLQGRCSASGSTCGNDDPPCCTGLQCKARIGQPPTCG
jgi:hypothetical protein